MFKFQFFHFHRNDKISRFDLISVSLILFGLIRFDDLTRRVIKRKKQKRKERCAKNRVLCEDEKTREEKRGEGEVK